MYLHPHSIILLLIFSVIYCHVNIEDDPPIDALQNMDDFNILASDKAQRNQFPYQISLQQYSKDNKFYHVCSGAVLSNKWVVSTAYCVTPTKIPLRVVAGLLLKYEIHPDVQVVDVESIVVHPDYNGGISENDIALLELQTFLVFTVSVQPISIYREVSQEIWGAAMLSGWNVQTQLSKQLSLETLRYMLVSIMVDTDCENVLRNSTIFSKKMLCSKNITQEFYCPGESGSPLVHEGYLVGITSWGLKPCGITVYTNVAAFVDFIQMYVDIEV